MDVQLGNIILKCCYQILKNCLACTKSFFFPVSSAAFWKVFLIVSQQFMHTSALTI